MSTSYDFPVADPLHRLSALVTALDDRIRAAVESASGLAGTGPDALLTIGHAPGLRVDDLAAMLRVSHSGAVRTVDRLVAVGLVVRRPAADDRRTVALHLTGPGERLRRIVIDARNREVGAVLGLLEPEQRQALGALVDTILVGVAAGEGDDHSMCRLCDPDDCAAGCPVDAAGAVAAAGRSGHGPAAPET
jgi:MarR family transcriptional regulator, negative regulator of the multidrug operon emrRAB